MEPHVLKKPAGERPADKRLETGWRRAARSSRRRRRLFAEHGYAAVSIEAVLAACEISRGVLYHHFASKEALLEAAFEAVEIDYDKVRAGAAQRDRRGRGGASRMRSLPRPHSGSGRAPDHADRRPFRVGWEKWREIDERHAFGLMKAALEPAAKEAGLPASLVDAFAHMLLASLSEIALMIAQADDTAAALENGRQAAGELLARILARPV